MNLKDVVWGLVLSCLQEWQYTEIQVPLHGTQWGASSLEAILRAKFQYSDNNSLSLDMEE